MTRSSLMSKEAKRAARHRAFAKARRVYALLIRLIGGPNPVCKWCGRNEHECELTIDHERGKNWRANKVRMDERIKRYAREFKAGVPMRLLCRECNSKDGRARQMEGRVSEVVEKRTARVERKRVARLDVDKLFDGDTPF